MLKCRQSAVPYLLRYLVRFIDFCSLAWKVTETSCVIAGVSGLIAIKLAQNVAKILPFNSCKSELRYSNPFRNASVLNGQLQILPKIGCHGYVP